MMSVMFALLAKMAFCDVIEGVNSTSFSFSHLVFLIAATSCMINAINL